MNSGTDTLTLGTGGLISQTAETWINGGQLTAGTGAPAELFAWVNAGTTHLTSTVADNGVAGLVTLVKTGPGTLSLGSANTHSGGTVVNQGTLSLDGTAGTVTLGAPAGGNGLTINNATVTEATVGGQIHPTTNVTLNGGSLNLVGANTLASLTLNAKGGSVSPTVNVGSIGNVTGTLNVTGNITATNNDPLGSMPSISGGNLTLGGGSTITVNGTAPTALDISSADHRRAAQQGGQRNAPDRRQ